MKRLPVVTALLVLAILACYGLELAAGGSAACMAWGLRPAHPTAAAVLASMFLHDPDSLAHVGGNVLALAAFGSVAERDFGGHRIALVYLLAGVGGALLFVVAEPTSTVPMVGASAAISGLMPLAAAARPRLVGFVATLSAYDVACVLLGGGSTAAHAANSGAVAHAAHVGGFAVGVLFALAARARGGLLAVA